MAAAKLALGAALAAGLSLIAYRQYQKSNSKSNSVRPSTSLRRRSALPADRALFAERLYAARPIQSVEVASGELSAKSVGPYRLRGCVVRGFQRGSKLLGFPTANLDPAAFEKVMDAAPHGVYIGFAQIAGGPVYRAFISLGLNPTFNNKQTTVEAYIDHVFADDFYGQEMALVIVAYLRPQITFTGLDNLIKAIKNDVTVGTRELQSKAYESFEHDTHFAAAKSKP